MTEEILLLLGFFIAGWISRYLYDRFKYGIGGQY